MAQSIKGVVAGLFSACQTIYNGATAADGSPVLVTYGPPGSNQPQAIVAVGMKVRQPVTRPTMGTNRSREKLVEVDVVFSVYVPGTETAQQPATEKCDDLIDLFEAYFRTAGNETLSGACRDSFVSNIDGPTPDVAIDPMSQAPAGRVAEATVSVMAAIRY